MVLGTMNVENEVSQHPHRPWGKCMFIITVSFQVLVLKGGVFSSDNTDKDLTIDLSCLLVSLDPLSQRQTGLETEFSSCRDDGFFIEKPFRAFFFPLEEFTCIHLGNLLFSSD